MTRFGMGYDVHRLVEGRKLIIGGRSVDFICGVKLSQTLNKPGCN